MKQDFSTFLQELSSLTESLNYEVFLESLNKTVSFKQLNTEQFNRILSTLVEDPSSKTGFNSVMCNILNENANDITFNSFSLPYFEYIKLVLVTRKQCISDTINLIFTQNEIETNQLVYPYTTYSLSNIPLDQKISSPNGKETVTIDNISAILNIPSVSDVIRFDNYIKIQNTDVTSELIKKFFIKEIAKYLKNLNIKENTFVFCDNTPEECIEIVNKLPASLVNEIIKNIELLKELGSFLVLANVTQIDTNNEEVTFVKEISIDANLFNY